MEKEIPGTKAIVFGQFISPEAYETRDYLGRLVVDYEWVEINNDEESIKKFGKPLNEVQYPVVVCSKGDILYRPTKRQLAEHMGWTFTPQQDEYDLIILGGGPAGLSAAVYAASEGLSTLVIEKNAVGGQAGSSTMIENYLGFPQGISGAVLAELARQQSLKFGAELILMQEGIRGFYKDGMIAIHTKEGVEICARSVICATGVNYRKLDLPDEDKFLNKGVYYGAGLSEGPFCANEHVFVVGGGNSAGQAVMNLSRYARQVTMVVRSGNLCDSLSKYLIDRIQNTDNINVMYESNVTALFGNDYLESIEITSNGKKAEYKTGRLFICIGGKPNVEYTTENDFMCDGGGYVLTGQDILTEGKPGGWKENRDPYHLETSLKGVFAIGDLRHNSVKRVASAVGEGAMVISFVHRYLKEAGYAII